MPSDLQWDRRTLFLRDGRSLLSPTGRLLRFRTPVAKVTDPRLVTAGAAHPVPAPHPAGDVTVVVPVKDRLPELDRCLMALQGRDVLVVDDGSQAADAVADLCGRYGVRLVRRPNGGPAAARNTALPLLDKDFVAFLDSDCVPPVDWLEVLRGHLEDPDVAAVAPRVTGGLRSPLDLGTDPGVVQPGAPVSYVPTAALLVRRSLLTPFDESLRYGEDVDWVWRTVGAGHQVRYDPRVVVTHREPRSLAARLQRRFRYGTSAAPLSRRHPDAVTHLVVPPWPTGAALAMLTGHPLVGAAATVVTAARVDRHLHDPGTSARVAVRAVTGTASGLGRALALAGPLAWAAARRRPVLLALLAAPLVEEQLRRRPEAGALRYVGEGLLEQAAYGTGVVTGCVRERTPRPLLPRLH